MKKSKLPILLSVFSLFGSHLIFGQDSESIIKNYIQTQKIRDFKKSDLTDFLIDIKGNSESMNGEVVKFQQKFNGYPVNAAVGTALIKDGKIVYFTENFVKDYSSSTFSTPSISQSAALKKVAYELGASEIGNYPVLGFYEGSNTDKVAKSRLVYFNENNQLKLAYEFGLEDPVSHNYWNILVDAANGTILDKLNLTYSCSFHHNTFSSEPEFHEHTNQQLLVNSKTSEQSLSAFAPSYSASYNVFQFPIEAPTFGTRSVVTNPWMLTSSPEGWHYDGTTHYTITKGNNVHAYEDGAGTNAIGFSPDGGASRNFDYTFDFNTLPVNNRSAAITNLFYANNKVHDIFYKFGFKENFRNFQKTNFGLGGTGNDHVLAEAQDGGGMNNANFSSPADGSSGRMQMYLWNEKVRIFFYNAPAAAVTRWPNAYTAEFGAVLDQFGVTGNVALASPIDGCLPITPGSLTNKIGLIERGNCNFVDKVKNAQDAGAIAAIIYNAPTSTTIGPMGGTDPTIIIPSVLINNSEGQYIKSQLAANTVVNVTLKNDPADIYTPDGSFDNGIIIHEYGHGISNRLTGTGYNCLNAVVDKEQMGEGWSDFFGLMLTNLPNTTAATPRGYGSYAVGQGPTGDGIRPMKYSPDFTINNATYGMTNGLEYNSNGTMVPDVHSIGFIWATMLWDLHWKYVELYGFASDVVANPTSGSARVLQLVVDGLKLQPCQPSFVEGRDALIAADLASTGGQNRCTIWRTFAKRGLGVNASAGAKSNINDQVQDFTVPTDCVLATHEATAEHAIAIYPNPARDEFFISFPSNTLGKVKVEVYDASGRLVMTQDKVTPNSKTAFSTGALSNGVYVVKVKGLGLETSSKLIVKK